MIASNSNNISTCDIKLLIIVFCWFNFDSDNWSIFAKFNLSVWLYLFLNSSYDDWSTISFNKTAWFKLDCNSSLLFCFLSILAHAVIVVINKGIAITALIFNQIDIFYISFFINSKQQTFKYFNIIKLKSRLILL